MYCSKCGKQIDDEAIVCVHCGVPTANYKQNQQSNVQVVNNVIENNNGYVNAKNKWISLLLCLFLGFLGFHKFYEGKILMGFLYALTAGFFGFGIFIDLIVLLFKPNPYCP